MEITEAQKILAESGYEMCSIRYESILEDGPEDEEDIRFDGNGNPSIEYLADNIWESWYEVDLEEMIEDDPDSEFAMAYNSFEEESDAASAYFEGFYQFVREKYGHESEIRINVQ